MAIRAISFKLVKVRFVFPPFPHLFPAGGIGCVFNGLLGDQEPVCLDLSNLLLTLMLPSLGKTAQA